MTHMSVAETILRYKLVFVENPLTDLELWENISRLSTFKKVSDILILDYKGLGDRPHKNNVVL